MAISEENIIAGCIAGDRSMQKLLYSKYASVMLSICMRYCKSKDEAEDVLQDGFIKVFGSISNFRKEGSFEGWIKRIIVNTALNNCRDNLKRNNHLCIDDIEETVRLQDINNDSLSENELLKMIQELPEGYKMVFNLYAFEGYSHKEIGDLLGISESTSKSQLSRARMFLQNKLKEYNNNPNLREILREI